MMTAAAAALLRGAEPAIKGKAQEAISAILAPRLKDGAVKLGAACWIYKGVNPT